MMNGLMRFTAQPPHFERSGIVVVVRMRLAITSAFATTSDQFSNAQGSLHSLVSGPFLRVGLLPLPVFLCAVSGPLSQAAEAFLRLLPANFRVCVWHLSTRKKEGRRSGPSLGRRGLSTPTEPKLDERPRRARHELAFVTTPNP
jgi:hypothetical protein